MTATAELALKVLMDAADAVVGFDKVENAAAGMASAVEQAAAKADAATDRISRVADSSDNLASKSSQATGSLGALASGFELVGAEKYAAGLQSAALATDFLSGVGDALNLVTAAGSLSNARATVTTIAKAAAEKTAAVATKAYTVAQWAMNAALTANPIGIAVVALAALAAAVVIAYRRSSTFREIVQTAMAIAREAIQRVGDKAIALGGWLLEMKDKAAKAGAGLKEKLVNAADGVRDRIASLRDQIRAYFAAMLAPVQSLIDKVQSVIDKIQSIPGIPGGGGDGSRIAARTGDPFTATPSGDVYHFTINGALDADSVVRQLDALMSKYARRTRKAI